VSRKQLLALVSHGKKKESYFSFSYKEARDGKTDLKILYREPDEDGQACAGDEKCINETAFTLSGKEQPREIRLRLFLEDVDPQELSIKVRMEVRDELFQGENPPEYWVDYFDFPMIDNTRLSGGYRLAVVMTDFDTSYDRKNEVVTGAARIVVLAFPEQYASLKDRAFLQDVLDEMRPHDQ
jgi:hypothetical protein